MAYLNYTQIVSELNKAFNQSSGPIFCLHDGKNSPLVSVYHLDSDTASFIIKLRKEEAKSCGSSETTHLIYRGKKKRVLNSKIIIMHKQI